MEYKLYTLVDITHTGQHRPESGREKLLQQEQNFQTVIQTLGLRANIRWESPIATEVRGKVVGFDTDEIIRVWRLDFATERDDVYDYDGDPVELLREDFELVPYITGLNERMKQTYAVFEPYGQYRNIVFFKK